MTRIKNNFLGSACSPSGRERKHRLEFYILLHPCHPRSISSAAPRSIASVSEPGLFSPPSPLEASCVREPVLLRAFPSSQNRPQRPLLRSGLSTRFRARRSWLYISIPVQR